MFGVSIQKILIYGLLFAVPYFLPAIVATVRRHRHRLAIWILDLFVAWTGIGWIALMLWAFLDQRPDRNMS